MQWPVVVPVAALLVLAAAWSEYDHWVVLLVVATCLTGAVVAAVHHAEVVKELCSPAQSAHGTRWRRREPIGCYEVPPSKSAWLDR
jgi:Mn2+/Fe2+ NRAMP family transporter